VLICVLVRFRILEICAILYTCKVLSPRDLRHFVHCCLFTVSIYIGATSVGCLLSGIMMDLWGRRLAVQIAISSVCIGWLLIANSATYPLMLTGRALCGFGKGFATPAVTVSYKHVQPSHVESVKNIRTHDNLEVKANPILTRNNTAALYRIWYKVCSCVLSASVYDTLHMNIQ